MDCIYEVLGESESLVGETSLRNEHSCEFASVCRWMTGIGSGGHCYRHPGDLLSPEPRGISLGALWGNVELGKRKHHLFPRACSLITVPNLTLGEIIQTNCPRTKSNCICKRLSSVWIRAQGYIVA